MEERSVWSLGSASLLVAIGAASAWIAAAITVLNLAGRVVMSLGGFVARGGPYEIAHPAPEWILLVPASIVTAAFVTIASVVISFRTGGFSLLPWLWSGLFVSLGYQFAVFGLNPPPGAGSVAWGWIICAVVFIPMGLAPLPGVIGLRAWWHGEGGGRAMFGLESPPGLYQKSASYRTGYVVCVVAGAAAGVLGGFALFRMVAG